MPHSVIEAMSIGKKVPMWVKLTKKTSGTWDGPSEVHKIEGKHSKLERPETKEKSGEWTHTFGGR